jgi:hypothetical protein
VLVGLLALARALVELAEAEVAMGDEGAHTELIRQRHRGAVLRLCHRQVRGVGLGRDVSCEVQCIRLAGPLSLLARPG